MNDDAPKPPAPTGEPPNAAPGRYRCDGGDDYCDNDDCQACHHAAPTDAGRVGVLEGALATTLEALRLLKAVDDHGAYCPFCDLRLPERAGWYDHGERCPLYRLLMDIGKVLDTGASPTGTGTPRDLAAELKTMTAMWNGLRDKLHDLRAAEAAERELVRVRYACDMAEESRDACRALVESQRAVVARLREALEACIAQTKGEETDCVHTICDNVERIARAALRGGDTKGEPSDG